MFVTFEIRGQEYFETTKTLRFEGVVGCDVLVTLFLGQIACQEGLVQLNPLGAKSLQLGENFFVDGNQLGQQLQNCLRLDLVDS